MGSVFETIIENDAGPTLAPRLQELHGSSVRKRIEELDAIVANLREALTKAEEELRREKARVPMVGDFVRCPLTNFFGRVTKVTPRPHGRPWIEITPYLARDLPGHGLMDLYESWELIDPPGEEDEPWQPAASPAPPAPSAPRLPSVSSYEFPRSAPPEDDKLAGEIEVLLGELWAEPGLDKKPA